MTLDQIQRGDGIITRNGAIGIATTAPFKAASHFDYEVVRVDFDGLEMPIQLISIAEVWRGGSRIDNQPDIQQLSLWGG